MGTFTSNRFCTFTVAMLRLIHATARLSRFRGRFLSQNVWKSGHKRLSALNVCPAAASLTNRHFHNTPQHQRKLREYDDVFNKSIEDPEGFWGDQADDIDWYKPYTRVMDNSNPPCTKWYTLCCSKMSYSICVI